MKTSDFNWDDDTIDSRDIISRYEELNDEYESLVEALDEAKSDLEEYLKTADEELTEEHEEFEETCKDLREVIENAQEALNSFEKDELDTLTEVISQGESSPDWSYGETLIHEDYFTQYAEELINDCWEMPKEMKEGNWPWNHLNMDWEAAAEELKSDYSTIEVDGGTYYIRG